MCRDIEVKRPYWLSRRFDHQVLSDFEVRLLSIAALSHKAAVPEFCIEWAELQKRHVPDADTVQQKTGTVSWIASNLP